MPADTNTNGDIFGAIAKSNGCSGILASKIAKEDATVAIEGMNFYYQ